MSDDEPDRPGKPPTPLEVANSQLAARLAQRENRTRHADRKAEDRRNVLLGQFLAAALQRNPKLRGYVETNIYRFHTRQRDRNFLQAYFAAFDKEPETPAE